MNNKELFTSLKLLEKEKGIPMDYMLEQIERAIKVACKNSYGGNENVVFKIKIYFIYELGDNLQLFLKFKGINTNFPV